MDNGSTPQAANTLGHGWAEATPVPWGPPRPRPGPLELGGVVLRPYEPADASALFEAVDRSRSALLPWLPWAGRFHGSVADSEAAIARFAQAAADPLDPAHNAAFGFVLGAFDARDGELVGGTGFNRMMPERHTAEVGYWVRADRRRQGWCTRMLRAAITLGLRPQQSDGGGGYGFRRLHIFASAANVASCGVPAKLGLHEFARARSDRFVEGIGWTDTRAWDVLADEWRAAGDSASEADIRPIEPTAAPGVCGPILRSVPEWFGIESSTLRYIEETGRLPTYVAWRAARAVGFITVQRHHARSAEISCMAVAKDQHRTGIGRALVRSVERRLRADGVEYLQVKTQGPSLPCDEYRRTTSFYMATGFVPLEELHGIWPGMPALVLVKRL